MALLQNVIARGTHAARPAAGSAGVLYLETDTGRLFRDNGTSWDAVDVLTTAGDLLYFDGTNLQRLGVGTTGQVLTVASGAPSWATASAGGITATTYGTTTQGASDEAVTSTYKTFLKKITPASAGLIPSVEAWIKGNGANVGNYCGVIYDDNAGVPGKILAVGTGSSANSVFLAATYRKCSAPVGYWAASGTAIWIGVLLYAQGGASLTIAYGGGGSDYSITSSGAWVTDGANSAPSSSTRDYSLSAHLLS